MFRPETYIHVCSCDYRTSSCDDWKSQIRNWASQQLVWKSNAVQRVWGKYHRGTCIKTNQNKTKGRFPGFGAVFWDIQQILFFVRIWFYKVYIYIQLPPPPRSTYKYYIAMLESHQLFTICVCFSIGDFPDSSSFWLLVFPLWVVFCGHLRIQIAL